MLSEKPYSGREEEQMLRAFGQALGQEFPNPDRVGCPGSETLKGIALRRIPLRAARPWLDHFSSCSPCFREFTAFRQTAIQRHTVTGIGIAAAILVASLLSLIWIRTHKAPGEASQVAVLDLRDRSAVRGPQPANANPPLLVPATFSQLVLDLPFGSPEGTYEIAVFDQSDHVILNRSARASMEDHAIVLRLREKVSLAEKGTYLLGIRRSDIDWSYYPVQVK